MMVQPVIYAFDDDATIHVDVEDVVTEVIKAGIDAISPVANPLVRTAREEVDCKKLIADFKRGNELPLFVVDLSFYGDEDVGVRLLREIRGKRSLRYAPVIMLTSYDEAENVNECFRYGANCFVVKSDEPSQLKDRLTLLIRFWLLNACHNRPLSSKGQELYLVGD